MLQPFAATAATDDAASSSDAASDAASPISTPESPTSPVKRSRDSKTDAIFTAIKRLASRVILRKDRQGASTRASSDSLVQLGIDPTQFGLPEDVTSLAQLFACCLRALRNEQNRSTPEIEQLWMATIHLIAAVRDVSDVLVPEWTRQLFAASEAAEEASTAAAAAASEQAAGAEQAANSTMKAPIADTSSASSDEIALLSRFDLPLCNLVLLMDGHRTQIEREIDALIEQTKREEEAEMQQEANAASSAAASELSPSSSSSSSIAQQSTALQAVASKQDDDSDYVDRKKLYMLEDFLFLLSKVPLDQAESEDHLQAFIRLFHDLTSLIDMNQEWVLSLDPNNKKSCAYHNAAMHFLRCSSVMQDTKLKKLFLEKLVTTSEIFGCVLYKLFHGILVLAPIPAPVQQPVVAADAQAPPTESQAPLPQPQYVATVRTEPMEMLESMIAINRKFENSVASAHKISALVDGLAPLLRAYTSRLIAWLESDDEAQIAAPAFCDSPLRLLRFMNRMSKLKKARSNDEFFGCFVVVFSSVFEQLGIRTAPDADGDQTAGVNDIMSSNDLFIEVCDFYVSLVEGWKDPHMFSVSPCFTRLLPTHAESHEGIVLFFRRLHTHLETLQRLPKQAITMIHRTVVVNFDKMMLAYDDKYKQVLYDSDGSTTDAAGLGKKKKKRGRKPKNQIVQQQSSKATDGQCSSASSPSASATKKGAATEAAKAPAPPKTTGRKRGRPPLNRDKTAATATASAAPSESSSSSSVDAEQKSEKRRKIEHTSSSSPSASSTPAPAAPPVKQEPTQPPPSSQPIAAPATSSLQAKKPATPVSPLPSPSTAAVPKPPAAPVSAPAPAPAQSIAPKPAKQQQVPVKQQTTAPVAAVAQPKVATTAPTQPKPNPQVKRPIAAKMEPVPVKTSGILAELASAPSKKRPPATKKPAVSANSSSAPRKEDTSKPSAGQFDDGGPQKRRKLDDTSELSNSRSLPTSSVAASSSLTVQTESSSPRQPAIPFSGQASQAVAPSSAPVVALASSPALPPISAASPAPSPSPAVQEPSSASSAFLPLRKRKWMAMATEDSPASNTGTGADNAGASATTSTERPTSTAA